VSEDEKLVAKAILDELSKQAERNTPFAPYVDADRDLMDVTIDGHVDVMALSAAIVAALKGNAA